MTSFNHERQTRLNKTRKALKAKESRKATITLVDITEAWDGLGTVNGEVPVGFCIWAIRTVGRTFLFETLKQAKEVGLQDQYAFDFVKHSIYSRLRETA